MTISQLIEGLQKIQTAAGGNDIPVTILTDLEDGTYLFAEEPIVGLIEYPEEAAELGKVTQVCVVAWHHVLCPGDDDCPHDDAEPRKLTLIQ